MANGNLKMGIGNWDKDDIIWFFKTGLLIDGDTVSGKMGDIIDESIIYIILIKEGMADPTRVSARAWLRPPGNLLC